MLSLSGGRVLLPSGDFAEADLIIDGDTIREVTSPPTVRTRADSTERIDAEGLHLVPGLIDMHTHLGHYKDAERDTETTAALTAARRASDALRCGITTVRDVGSHRNIALGLRDAIERKDIPGPKMVATGAFLAMTGGHGFQRAIQVDGADAVRRATRGLLAAGADLIKIMCSGGVIRPGERAHATQFSEAEMRAAIEEAHAAGKTVAAHAHPAVAIRRAVDAGARSIEHGSFLDDETARRMHDANAFLVPTFAVFELLGRGTGTVADQARRVQEQKRRSFEIAVQRDVEWAVGSDCGAYTPVSSYIDELIFLSDQLGLAEIEVLRHATQKNAQLLGLPSVGELRPGYRADIIATRGSPLDGLSQLRDVQLTVAGGTIYDWR